LKAYIIILIYKNNKGWRCFTQIWRWRNFM